MSQPANIAEEPCEDNYVTGTDADFLTRAVYWMSVCPGTTVYHIQLAAIFEAGACINTNLLEKEPQKLKEMATKYKEVCISLVPNVITNLELKQVAILKHAAKNKSSVTVEVEGWPSGRSLWDRYIDMRKNLRTKIMCLLPKSIPETPSGTGLKKAFETAALQLYKKSLKKEEAEEVGDDAHDQSLQETINKLTKKPFAYLFTARCFFGHAVLAHDMAAQQEANPPASKATLKAQERLKKKERAMRRVEEQQKVLDVEEEEAKRMRLMNAENLKTKADSLKRLADGHNMKNYFEMAEKVYSPETFKKMMRLELQGYNDAAGIASDPPAAEVARSGTGNNGVLTQFSDPDVEETNSSDE